MVYTAGSVLVRLWLDLEQASNKSLPAKPISDGMSCRCRISNDVRDQPASREVANQHNKHACYA